MGFKELLTKVKDGAAKTAKVTKRYNDGSFIGNIDHGVTDGVFGQGAYLNVYGSNAVIYGVNTEEYTFSAADVASIEEDKDYIARIGKGGDYHPATRCKISFNDGKTVQADILSDKFSSFKTRFYNE